MDKKAEIIFKILGLGTLVTLINRLEFADFLYKIAIGLPQPIRDILLVIVISIIIVAAKSFDNS